MEKKKTLKGIMKLMLTTFVVMGMGLFLCNPEVKAVGAVATPSITPEGEVSFVVSGNDSTTATDVGKINVYLDGAGTAITLTKSDCPGADGYGNGTWKKDVSVEVLDYALANDKTTVEIYYEVIADDGSTTLVAKTSSSKSIGLIKATWDTSISSTEFDTGSKSLTGNSKAKISGDIAYALPGGTVTYSIAPNAGYLVKGYKVTSAVVTGATLTETSGALSVANTIPTAGGEVKVKPEARDDVDIDLYYGSTKITTDPATYDADNAVHAFTVKVTRKDAGHTDLTSSITSPVWDQKGGTAAAISTTGNEIKFKTSSGTDTSTYEFKFTLNGDELSKTFAINAKAVTPTLVPNKIKLFNGSTEVTDFTKILFAADNANHPFSIKLYKDATEVTTGYDVIVWTPDDTTSTVQHTATGKTVNVKSNKKFGGKTISVKVYPTGTATPVPDSTTPTVAANFTFTAVPQVAKVVATDDGTKEYTSTNPAEFDANGSEKSYTLKAYDAEGNNITQYVEFKGPANGTTGDITHTFTEAGAVIKVKATKTAEATLNFYAKTTLETWPSSPTAYPVKFKATVPLSVDMIITSPTSDDGKEVDITAGKTVKFKATISGVASNDLIYTVYTDETVKKTSGITKSTSGSNIILTWSHTYSKTGEYTPWIEITRKSDSATREDACAVNVDTDQLPMSLSSPASPVIVTVGHKTLVKLVTNSDFKNYLEDYDASDIEINFYKGKTSTTAVTTYCAATNIKKVDKNTLTFCIQGKALYTDADLYVNISIDDTLVCKEFTTKIYKAPSVISSTTAATSGTPSVKFHIPTHVGTTQSNNMTVKGYEVKVYNNGNEVKSLGTVEATPGDLVFELNSDRVNKIAEGINADSYSFTLQAIPVGQINGVGDTTSAKTYNDLSALTGEKDLLSGASSAFTIYRVSVSAGEDVQVGSYSGWGFAGQSVNLTATSSKYDPSGIQWSKSGNTASALAKGTSYTHKISTSTADNKLTAVLATKTPTGTNGAGGATPGTGSSDGLDDVPKTAESNAPIWLIIVLVFAAMGGAYALYLQMRPATVVDTTKTSFYNRDDDYSDDI